MLEFKSPYWCIDPPKDYGVFFAKIPSFFGDSATLCLEGTSFSDEVREFFTESAIEPLNYVHRATIWPESELIYLPSSESVLFRLEELCSTNSSFEICDHLWVLSADSILIAWFDFPVDEILVAGHLLPDLCHGIADSIGGKCLYVESDV